jgi:hypothetical protein
MLTFLTYLIAGVVLGLLMVGFFNMLYEGPPDPYDEVAPYRHYYTEGCYGMRCLKCGEYIGRDLYFGCEMSDAEYEAWANSWFRRPINKLPDDVQ